MKTSKTYQMGILGCGDFLRWMAPAIKGSQNVSVRWLFDPMQERAARYTAELGGQVAGSHAEIFSDPKVDIVCLFVPPWLRTDLWIQAAQAGKHILATKPLVASISDCERITALGNPTRCGVLYGRSGDGWSVALKRLLDSGEIGKLALYRQDWLHHYPQWNTWALDPSKNGGPFMDAMIHNLNLSRYLMGRPIVEATFFSEKLSHPDLACADTETMKITFAGNGSALLFITWAADLAVYSTDGNNREHIDIFYLITDQGWRITKEWTTNGAQIIASRAGVKQTWQSENLGGSVFDRFVKALDSGSELPEDIVSVEMAIEDIRLLRTLEGQPGEKSWQKS
jgi:predicted dehydrogenase